MSTQPTQMTVRIGLPLDQLPTHLGGAGHPADHWTAIAEACRKTPGKWRRVELSLTADRHRTAARNIRNGELAAFTKGDWDAAMRRGELYIRYLGEAPAAPAFVFIDEAEAR